MALVLDQNTRYVSPQFHVKIDTGFYTLKQEELGSRWQYKTYFMDKPQRSRQLPKKRKMSTDSEGARVDTALVQPEETKTSTNCADPHTQKDPSKE